MSVKRVYYVKHARQRFAKESGGERVEVKGRKARSGGQMTRIVRKNDKSRPLPNEKCSKCGDEIKVGDPYRYWEPFFRSSYRTIRCMKATCTPRMSELESSKIASAYAARESVEDTLGTSLGDAEDAQFFNDLAQEVVDALDEIIDEYREADETFGGSGSSQSAERADELESAKDNLESTDFEEPPERDELEACLDPETNKEYHGEDDPECEKNTEGCPTCDETYNDAMTEWRDNQAQTLTDAMSEF